MNRVELLSSKFNKFIKRDYPIIKNIEIDDVSIKNGFVNFEITIEINKSDFINNLNVNQSFIDLVTSVEDNKIHDYWLKRFDLDVFNWLDIRKDLKSFSKMYYNEKIQNFICKVLLV